MNDHEADGSPTADDAAGLPPPAPGPLRLPERVGGALCLDFVNTVDNRLHDRPRDRLASYADLLAWAEYAGAIGAEHASRLRCLSATEPVVAAAAFTRARLIREVIFRVMAAVVEGQIPADADRVALERAYIQALAHARLTRDGGAYRWAWDEPSQPYDLATASPADDLDRPLWPIVASAVELLTRGDLSRVKRCASTIGCGWLFVDTSKNATRRWCSMEMCGSRAKMRRLYARRRAVAP